AECSALSVPSMGSATRSVDLRPLGRLDQTLDLFVGEAGHPAHVRRDRDRHRIVVALPADATEIEPLVDALLELDRATPTLGIALGQLGQPLRAHADVRGRVGQGEVDRTLEGRIAARARPLNAPV